MTTKKSHKAKVSERIAEYVNSSRLKQRVRSGNKLSCVVLGNYGVYQTRVTLDRHRLKDASCTCPSDPWPCKHVHALAETYRKHPRSFVDVEKILAPLKDKPQKDLLKTIRTMIEEAPSSLRALGVKGFEDISREQEEEFY